jgi:hypothetical protein
MGPRARHDLARVRACRVEPLQTVVATLDWSDQNPHYKATRCPSASIDAARAAAPQLHAAQELSRALPQYASLFGLDGGEHLAALPVEERDRVTGEVRVYLEAHPELTALVERAERLSDGVSVAERASSS